MSVIKNVSKVDFLNKTVELTVEHLEEFTMAVPVDSPMEIFHNKTLKGLNLIPLLIKRGDEIIVKIMIKIEDKDSELP